MKADECARQIPGGNNDDDDEAFERRCSWHEHMVFRGL